MSLIDHSYSLFTNGDFKLSFQTTNYDFDKVLDGVCTTTEKEILTKLFGDAMYLDYENNQSDYAELIAGYKIDSKYATFEYLGKKRVYRGLYDMLAYFTYFYYSQDRFIFDPSTEEEKKSDTIRDNRNQKILDAYHLAYKLYYDAYYFIKYKQSLDSTNFPDFDFSDIELINSFGI